MFFIILTSYFLLVSYSGEVIMTPEQRHIVCPDCKGKGFVACPECKGQGRQRSSTAMQRPCLACRGKGTSVCALCKGAKRIEKKG